MKPPNTHWLRKFNERAKLLNGTSPQIVPQEEIRGVCNELTDVLCYIIELENKITSLNDALDNTKLIEVEMIGKDF